MKLKKVKAKTFNVFNFFKIKKFNIMFVLQF